MRFKLFLFLTAGTVGLAGAAAAEDAARASPTEVGEVVVTAAPYAVSEESITSHVDVMNREALDAAPPAGLGDVLNGLPGVRSSAFGPGASRPIIRGLSGPRVLVLQNGLGQIDASDVSPDHAVASDPSQAERIEVLRGPSTIAFGGSGIGGVVNVLDERVPTRPAANGVEGHLSASGSTVDDGRSVAGSVKLGQGPWVFAFDGSSRRTDDYETPVAPVSRRFAEAEGVVASDDRVQRNTDTATDAVGAGVSYVGDGGFLGASIKQLKSRYGVPYAQLEDEPPGGEEGPVYLDLEQVRVDVRGEHDIDLGPFERLRAAGGWADYEHSEIGVFSGEVGTTFKSDGYEGRVELVQRDLDGWQGAVGVQALKRSLEAIGDEAFIPSVDIGEVAIFTLQRLDKGGWGLEGGVRLDRRRLETPDDARTFTNLSGSVAAFWRPAEGWFASLNYAHNSRSPTEVELFADGPHAGTGAFEIGDRDLDAERVDSGELTVRYTGGRLRLEAHGYVARYDGYIEERRTGEVEDGLPVFQFVQTSAKFRGLELEGGYDLWRDGERTLAVEAAYDRVRGQAGDGPLARIPPASFTGRLSYGDGRFEGRLEARHVAEQDRVAALETPTESYTLWNAYLAWKPWPDRDLKLFAEGRNLTDEEAREHASFLKDIAVQPGRNLRLGVAYSF
ncbi:MAG: TonB-dependent receptor [Caulobacteraceae bacterium]|nr:TonB-dependent receptor [Caulobacteraceae bacterium]